MIPQNVDFESYDDILSYRRAVVTAFPELDEGIVELPPGHRFWKVYAEQKDALKQARIFVYKPGDSFVAEAKPLHDPEAKTRRELNAAIEKWQSHFTGHCGQSFSEMLIRERRMKNGNSFYNIQCPRCGQTLTSAIPFVLVEHLLKDENLELVTRVMGGKR